VLLENALARVLDALEVNCVFDVGAWRGDYAMFLRRLGYAGRIVSFEPVAEVSRSTRRLTQADPGWVIHDYALGRRTATLDFHVSASSDMSSFLVKNAYAPPPIGDVRIVRVERQAVRRLDGLYPELVRGIDRPRVFLKLDTQGYDLEVVAGAEGCLEDIVGLQSEVSVVPLYDGMPTYLEALARYHDLGFSLVGLFDVLRDERTLNILEYDCVMLRNDAIRAPTGRTDRGRR
jgi:FkbM family methyltransferase